MFFPEMLVYGSGMPINSTREFGFPDLPAISNLCPPHMQYSTKERICKNRCGDSEIWDPSIPGPKQCTNGWQNFYLTILEESLNSDQKLKVCLLFMCKFLERMVEKRCLQIHPIIYNQY